MLLSCGETSKCAVILAWLKSSNLFRASIVVKGATKMKTGPIKLPSDDAFCQMFLNFPKGHFLRNEDGSLPMLCVFVGRKRFEWAVNSSFERTFGIKAADNDNAAFLTFCSGGYSSAIDL